jgi:hypothetical protein
VYRKIGEPWLQVEQRNSVAGWDDHVLYGQRVRNYTPKPIELEVRRSFWGHVVFRSQLGATPHDYQTVQYTATVPPFQKADLRYEVLTHCGRNAQQNNVVIENAPAGGPPDAGNGQHDTAL